MNSHNASINPASVLDLSANHGNKICQEIFLPCLVRLWSFTANIEIPIISPSTGQYRPAHGCHPQSVKFCPIFPSSADVQTTQKTSWRRSHCWTSSLRCRQRRAGALRPLRKLLLMAFLMRHFQKATSLAVWPTGQKAKIAIVVADSSTETEVIEA